MLPVVVSMQEVPDLLMASTGPGSKYRATLSISYGAGYPVLEVCNLKISDRQQWAAKISIFYLCESLQNQPTI